MGFTLAPSPLPSHAPAQQVIGTARPRGTSRCPSASSEFLGHGMPLKGVTGRLKANLPASLFSSPSVIRASVIRDFVIQEAHTCCRLPLPDLRNSTPGQFVPILGHRPPRITERNGNSADRGSSMHPVPRSDSAGGFCGAPEAPKAAQAPTAQEMQPGRGKGA